MKKFYLFTGRDTKSDDGRFEILVQADGPVTARVAAKNHLTKVNRVDLIKQIGSETFVKVEKGILHSTVEGR